MELINSLVTGVAIALSLLVFRGFVWHAKPGNDPALRLFAVSWCIGIGTFVVQRAFWDIWPTILGPERWPLFFEAIGGRALPNLTFSVFWLASAFYGLRALHAIIPEGERENWTIFTAPFYPHKPLTGALMKWRQGR